jgi:hypothetical protein
MEVSQRPSLVCKVDIQEVPTVIPELDVHSQVNNITHRKGELHTDKNNYNTPRAYEPGRYIRKTSYRNANWISLDEWMTPQNRGVEIFYEI